MSRQKRMGLAALAVALLVSISFLQQPIDKLRPQFRDPSVIQGEKTGLLFELSAQFVGAAAMGLREAVASVLWVRADEFFHNGEYEAILPLVRLVTWLDPHQLDVYSTGAWHLDYNFTDYYERSDRRYIPPAIALMKEGIENNPDIYDLYFDLGWMHYLQKIKDYENAAKWIELAARLPSKDPNTGEKYSHPGFVDRMLAHAYEKAGDLKKAEEQWGKSLKLSEEDLRKYRSKDASAYQEVDVCKKNWGLLCLRQAWRYGDMAAYERGIRVLRSLNIVDPNQKRALAAAEKSYAEFKARDAAPHDIQPPIDAKFSATWKRVGPKILVIEGKLALVPAEAYKGLASEPYTLWYQENQKQPPNRRKNWQNGCRVRILLEDYDYDYWKINDMKSFTWEVDKTRTVMVDDVMVRNGEFNIRIVMSKDPSIYPFSKDKYRLVLWFNPREAPDYIQDRIGWNGEGMIDKNYLDTKLLPGVRLIRKEFILKKSDIV